MNVAVTVRADMAVEKKSLGSFYDGIAVFEVDLAFSQSLYFRAEKRDPCLIRLLYKIIVIGFSVGADNLLFH